MSDEVVSAPLTFTVTEGNILLAYLDVAVKALGLQSASNAAFLANKIKSAFPQVEEPAKEAA